MSSLYIDRRGIELELDAEALVFRENGERVGTVPLAPLSRVFMRGDVRCSAALLGKLGERGIGVVILSGRQGRASLMLARPHNDARRRVEQIRRSLDESFCLNFARTLIGSKISRQIEWFEELRQRDMQARYELSHTIRLLESHRARLKEADSEAGLRGLEGAAAASYFAGLKAVVPESFGFKSRNRRPPRDPFNALLSLTYTLLHAELVVGLYGAGFDPYVGFYHRLDFGRESLASDLLEPLRPLADLFALRLVRQRVVSADDFSQTEAGCLLGKAGRARYYEAYEQASEMLRAGISREIDALAEALGCANEAPAADRVSQPIDGEVTD